MRELNSIFLRFLFDDYRLQNYDIILLLVSVAYGKRKLVKCLIFSWLRERVNGSAWKNSDRSMERKTADKQIGLYFKGSLLIVEFSDWVIIVHNVYTLYFITVSLTWHNILRYYDAKLINICTI